VGVGVGEGEGEGVVEGKREVEGEREGEGEGELVIKHLIISFRRKPSLALYQASDTHLQANSSIEVSVGPS
jgi:hypothetical protein